jgi:hypothetical protein
MGKAKIKGPRGVLASIHSHVQLCFKRVFAVIVKVKVVQNFVHPWLAWSTRGQDFCI